MRSRCRYEKNLAQAAAYLFPLPPLLTAQTLSLHSLAEEVEEWSEGGCLAKAEAVDRVVAEAGVREVAEAEGMVAAAVTGPETMAVKLDRLRCPSADYRRNRRRFLLCHPVWKMICRLGGSPMEALDNNRWREGSPPAPRCLSG